MVTTNRNPFLSFKHNAIYRQFLSSQLTWVFCRQTVNASSMRVTPGDQTPSRPRPLLVTGLRPYTVYRFSVRIKSSLAESDELWSEPARLQVRTLPLGEWGGAAGGGDRRGGVSLWSVKWSMFSVELCLIIFGD